MTMQKMITSSTAYHLLLKELEQGIYKPIYYLMGEEPFYIDSISDYIREHALPVKARDFNQIVLYGKETTMKEVIQRAKAYPMGYNRQVIIVKEAQHLWGNDSEKIGSPTDILNSYLQQPQPSTILVFCHKNGSLSKSKKIIPLIEKNGVLFESKKVKEDALHTYIEDFLQSHKLQMPPKGILMMSESVGTDLTRLNGELEKLVIALPEKTKEITTEFIEEHIKISKDYNVFELSAAVINKDVLKANMIASYYEKNFDADTMQLIRIILFKYFSNLLLAFYVPDKTSKGIIDQLDLKYSWQVKDYITGMHNYTATQTMNIISTIRKYDGRAKGVDASGNTKEGLLKEMLYIILHA